MSKKLRKPKGPFRDEHGEYWLLPLTRGLKAKISPEDVAIVSRWNWTASRESRDTKDYAVRWEIRDGRRYKIRLHRFVLGLPPGLL